MFAAALWASCDQSTGGPATSEVEFGAITLRASGGGGSGIAVTFLWRSDKVGVGGAVGATLGGRTSRSIGVTVGVAGR